jgi:hypothetical protein
MIAVSAGCRTISNSSVEEGLGREGWQPSNTQNRPAARVFRRFPIVLDALEHFYRGKTSWASFPPRNCPMRLDLRSPSSYSADSECDGFPCI